MGTDYNKQWYEKNKEKHKKYVSEKIKCECGRSISRSRMSAHLKTTYHEKRMKDTNKQMQTNLVNEILYKLKNNKIMIIE